MRYLASLILIGVVSCTGSYREPKFHYGQLARIIDGFYSGCTGIVSSYVVDRQGVYYFLSEVTCNNKDTMMSSAIPEFNLKVIK